MHPRALSNILCIAGLDSVGAFARKNDITATCIACSVVAVCACISVTTLSPFATLRHDLSSRSCIHIFNVGWPFLRQGFPRHKGEERRRFAGIWVDFKVLTYIYIVQTNEPTPNEAITRNGDRDAGARMPGKAGLLALGIADMRQR